MLFFSSRRRRSRLFCGIPGYYLNEKQHWVALKDHVDKCPVAPLKHTDAGMNAPSKVNADDRIKYPFS